MAGLGVVALLVLPAVAALPATENTVSFSTLQQLNKHSVTRDVRFPRQDGTARQPRQSSSPGGGSIGSRGDCLFGSGADVDLCDWDNVPFSAFEWLPSNGKDSFWIGGPRKDSNANNELGE